MKTLLLLATTLCCSLMGSQMQLLPGTPEPSATAAPLDLDQCGSCAQSNETCSSARITGYPTCRCDADCEVYRDCCTDRPRCQEPVTHTAASAQGLVFQCRSIYLDSNRILTDSGSFVPSAEEAFWMASACPDDWLSSKGSTEEAVFIEGNCTRGSSSLPPVSDRDTGLVYVNEYCAVCNRVDNIVPWSYRLGCSAELLTIIQDNPRLLTQDLIQEHCAPCTFVEPAEYVLASTGLPAPPARACGLHISSCLSQEELDLTNRASYNRLVQNCTQGPYSLVTEWSGLPYRNQYCALCNGIDPTAITVNCYKPDTLEEIDCTAMADEVTPTTPLRLPKPDERIPAPLPPNGTFPPDTEFDDLPLNNIELRPEAGPAPISLSFSLVLDIHGGGINVRSEVITTTISIVCNSSEVFDPISNSCRPTACPEGYTLNGGVCGFRNATTNATDVFSCPDGFRPADLNDTDYTDLGNDTVLFNEEIFDVIGYLEGNPVVCLNPNGSVSVNVTVLYYSYPTGYFLLTYIGCSLSVLGTILILITHILFKELRTLPSKILMNLAAAILTSNLFILIGGPITSNFPSTNLCTSVGIILHMFFLAQFSWMSVMAFEMVRTLWNAMKLVPDSKHFKTKLFVGYFIMGWSIPLAITIVSIIVNFTTDNLVLYGELEDGTQGSCWINHLESAIVAFIVPVALSILFNGATFVCVTVLLCSAWRAESKLGKDKHVPFVRVYVAIFSVTGLTWIFGFLAILAGTVWAWYPFIILNSIQGFIIFIIFLFTKKVGQLYLDLLHCRTPWQTEAKILSTKQTLRSHKNGAKFTSKKTDSESYHTSQSPANTDSAV